MSRSFFRYRFKVIVTTFFISQAFYVVGKNNRQNVKRPPNHEYTFITQNNRAILALPPSPPPLSPPKKTKILPCTYVCNSHILKKYTMQIIAYIPLTHHVDHRIYTSKDQFGKNLFSRMNYMKTIREGSFF